MLVNCKCVTFAGAAASSSSIGAAPIAKPPIGIIGASGRFNLFFKISLSSDTSIKFNCVISETSFSIFGDAFFSTVDGCGIVIASAVVCVSRPAWFNTVLKF